MTTHSNSTLAILGGAGKAGRPLVQEALSRGYHVRLLLRHPEQFTIQHDRLTIIRGDARDVDRLGELISGCTAVISTLGNPRQEGTAILSTVTRHLLGLMPTANVSRYVSVTSLYETDQLQTHLHTKLAAEYMDQHFPLFMADRRTEYSLLKDSGLDWTYVRLPFLTREPATGRVETSLAHLPGQQITAPDLARFLVDQVDDSQFIRKAPFVANV